VRVFYKGARTRLAPASEERRVNMLIPFSWVSSYCLKVGALSQLAMLVKLWVLLSVALFVGSG